MKATTFTVLVTVNHEGTAPECKTLEAQIQQGLEEGTREHVGMIACCVNVFKGDQLVPQPDVLKAKSLHQDLRNNP